MFFSIFLFLFLVFLLFYAVFLNVYFKKKNFHSPSLRNINIFVPPLKHIIFISFDIFIIHGKHYLWRKMSFDYVLLDSRLWMWHGRIGSKHLSKLQANSSATESDSCSLMRYLLWVVFLIKMSNDTPLSPGMQGVNRTN